MVAHVSYPLLDPIKNRPASLSPTITTDLLRRQLFFGSDGDHPPEDSFYMWGPNPPEDFAHNYEVAK